MLEGSAAVVNAAIARAKVTAEGLVGLAKKGDRHRLLREVTRLIVELQTALGDGKAFQGKIEARLYGVIPRTEAGARQRVLMGRKS